MNLYSSVTRYTTSTFLHMKLGDALRQRDVAPHIYESPEEARRYLKMLEEHAGQPHDGNRTDG